MCDYDPFPIAKPSPRFHTVWPRIRSSTFVANDSAPVDVEALIAALDKLSLQGANDGGVPTIPRRSSVGHILRGQHVECFPPPAYAPPAPLPALRPTVVSVHPAKSKVAGVLLGSYRVVDVGEAMAHSSRTSLPKRVPKSAHTLARDSMHPYVSLVPSRRYSKQRRLSSSSSLSSICSDSSSSSMFSSPSSVDSPLLTPPQLLVDLPHPAKLSTSAFMLGPTPDLDRLFNSSSPASPRPYDGFHLNALSC